MSTLYARACKGMLKDNFYFYILLNIFICPLFFLACMVSCLKGYSYRKIGPVYNSDR